MTSTNTVVANAMAARTARNAYCEAGDYIETRDGGQETVERVVGDKVYLKSGDVIRMSDVKAILNASCTARNADRYEEKSFGNGDVKASLKDFGRDPIYEIAVYATGITTAVSFADKGKKCVAEARAVLSAVERKASALKQAIAWMEQNAKAW